MPNEKSVSKSISAGPKITVIVRNYPTEYLPSRYFSNEINYHIYFIFSKSLVETLLLSTNVQQMKLSFFVWICFTTGRTCTNEPWEIVDSWSPKDSCIRKENKWNLRRPASILLWPVYYLDDFFASHIGRKLRLFFIFGTSNSKAPSGKMDYN